MSFLGIPVWAIVAMVVGTVLLLFVFFGACGLFFGLKRNKKGDLDFDDPPEVFDQMSPWVIIYDTHMYI